MGGDGRARVAVPLPSRENAGDITITCCARLRLPHLQLWRCHGRVLCPFVQFFGILLSSTPCPA